MPVNTKTFFQDKIWILSSVALPKLETFACAFVSFALKNEQIESLIYREALAKGTIH